MSGAHRDEQGFILATAILALVVLGAAVAAGSFVANQEYHVGKSMRQATHAFYASEAGLQRVFATWSIRDRWTMDGGDTLTVGPPSSLGSGVTYTGLVTRVDNTPQSDTDTERYYVIRIEGRSRSRPGEETASRQLLMLRVRYYDFCCSAAITAKDTVDQAGNSGVTGHNGPMPSAWAGECDSSSTASAAGVEVECPTCYTSGGQQDTVMGSPRIHVDTALQSQSLTEWDEVDFDFLKSKAAAASKTYPGPYDTATPTEPGLPIMVDGVAHCNEGVLNNWGAPTDAAHVCFDYFPIIYAAGDLELSGKWSGQGLLIVEGNLIFKGNYEFYGIVLVKGHLVMEGTAGGAANGGPKLFGSAVVAGQTRPGDPITNSRIAGNATIQYSACAIDRAKRFAELARKEALPLRAWVEGF